MGILSRTVILGMLAFLAACANLDSENEQPNSSYVNMLIPLNTPVPNAVTSLTNEGFACDKQTLMYEDEITCSREASSLFYNEVERVDLIADASRRLVVEARERPVACYGFFCKYRDI